MKDKKIIMVGCQHFNSGIGNYGFELSKVIKEKTADLSLFKPSKKGSSDEYFHHKYDWIKPFSYRSFKNLHPYVLPYFIKSGIKETADIYHAHWFLSGLAMLSNAKKSLVVTMHDVSLLHILESNNFYKKYYKWVIEKFKKKRIPLIVVSEKAKLDAIEHAQYPEELLHVVHNGINFSKFRPLAKRRKKNSKFNIIYTGGLGKRKNLELLLKAFRDIEIKYPQATLKIAGAFPEQTQYPEMAENLKIRNIHFTGYIPDHKLNNFYNSGDLLIYTSKYEGFGFAPLEAMAAGIPVLTTRGGALKETAGKGATFIEYDVDDIVHKTSKIIESESLRGQMKIKGFSWVKQYTWEAAANKTLNIYQNL